MAKVHRDHLMDEYDKVYPGYGFSQNKGIWHGGAYRCDPNIGNHTDPQEKFRTGEEYGEWNIFIRYF